VMPFVTYLSYADGRARTCHREGAKDAKDD
jgi:hypothetical protein